MNRQTDGRTDGQINRWKNGWMDNQAMNLQTKYGGRTKIVDTLM
jgi:hypothetical protein